MKKLILTVALLLSVCAQVADSGTINRPTKTFGGTAYVNGVIPDASDFNGDITTIYSDYNGNISNINIASNAAIDGSKVSPTFTTADILVQKNSPCLSLWDTSQLADSRVFKLCSIGGILGFGPYSDAGVSQPGGFNIDRSTGNLNFLGNTSDSPAGEVKMFAGSAAPTGYLMCDGSAVNRTTYAALFAVIGTTYGAGDGSTTFNVPDMRGRVPIGVGTGTGGGSSGTGLPSGGSALTAVARGTWKGEEKHTLTVGELATHNHTITYNDSVAGANASVNAGAVNTDGGGTIATGNAGSNTPHNIIQPVMGLNFIIKT